MSAAELLALLSGRTKAGAPHSGETYDGYLDSFGLLGRGFVYGELVRDVARDPQRRKAEPPRTMWSAMVPTLALAHLLRDRMRQLGARGLAVHAAYRPGGGEPNSQHKQNAALDLDLLPGDAGFSLVFAHEAALLWREHEGLQVGVGTYAPDGKLWTNRVHLDTGYRHRCWQGIGRNSAGRYLFSRHPAALVLAAHDETEPDSRELVDDGSP